MRACGFCLSYSGLLKDKILAVLGRHIRDLCKSCFVGGDFALISRVVCVGVVDPTCVLLGLLHWIFLY